MKATPNYLEKITRLFTGKHAESESSILVENADFVVVDTELTGLDPKRDSIVSIGAIKMTGSRIDIGQSFYRLISPNTTLTPESIIVHGLVPSELNEMPSIDSTISEFLDFCGSRVIVGHFVSLDAAFLNREVKRICKRVLDNPLVDTYKVHEWIRQNNGNFSRQYMADDNKDLYTLAREFRIEVTGAHNAMMDAFITAQLFQRFMDQIQKLGVRTIKDLILIGKP